MAKHRNAEQFPVRHWLTLSAASAGMGAALWGLSLAGPQVGVASADTESSVSASAGDSGTPQAGPSRAERRAERAEKRAEKRAERRAEAAQDIEALRGRHRAAAVDRSLRSETAESATADVANDTAAYGSGAGRGRHRRHDGLGAVVDRQQARQRSP